jgi:hypothetical protein
MTVVEREKFLKALAKYDPRGNANTLPSGTAARFYEALLLDEPIFGEINVRPAYAWALEEAEIDAYGVTAHHTTRHTGATSGSWRAHARFMGEPTRSRLPLGSTWANSRRP